MRAIDLLFCCFSTIIFYAIRIPYFWADLNTILRKNSTVLRKMPQPDQDAQICLSSVQSSFLVFYQAYTIITFFCFYQVFYNLNNDNIFRRLSQRHFTDKCSHFAQSRQMELFSAVELAICHGAHALFAAKITSNVLNTGVSEGQCYL